MNRGLIECGEILHLKNDILRFVAFFRETLGQFTANHHRNDLVHVQPFQRTRIDPLAITQNGDLIANRKDLFHFVRDVHHPTAFFFELFDDGKKMVYLFFGQG
ncbi:Uncharacterised protein [Vibrio cholerae]|uniref:Uncharacterized protein n=1 Tax=Vibrio cholerae TaxID=666 RepID=A0A655P9B6_VIBCL|nr:Uncharacterised protein [Vibrio cholerae]CSC67638.1 Uncharacterised protein [Vibrio cholerae]